MKKLKVLDLFSGIGGFSLGLERTGGFETVAFCEIEEFPRRVLAKHWPKVKQYGDVRQLTADVLRADGIAVDVICGGFPCQDISVAGQQAGLGEWTRSGLWSEIARLVSELRPQYLLVENVANLLAGPSQQPGGWFGRVLGDLAERGYDVEWENIPASAMGAPHRRERVWLVAYPRHEGVHERRQHDCSDQEVRQLRRVSRDGVSRGTEGKVLAYPNILNAQRQFASVSSPQGREKQRGRQAGSCGDGFGWWDAEPDVGRVAHGVPDRVHRLKALGNAVVPQITELIGHAILSSDHDLRERE